MVEKLFSMHAFLLLMAITCSFINMCSYCVLF
ncbi:hypothetical protein OIU76_014551 [Salix suchowensis]|uniref:Uncharacterized protein n=2 Tax=Salix TaxID=40685 RepID=A0A9Q0TQ51_9ROSI|nr:hypothetical protein OIU76_014551 [Salix suchowensis]KAJ6384790.1 hypothetical protein OIU77_028074 [Salix suchowensis]KAJ6715718.1 hypothetical protein OIU74_008456 [Salix koriyanagi]